MASNTIDSDARFERSLKLYAIDILAAMGSAMAVSPVIKIIDQVVTQKAAWPRVNMFRTAVNHFKNFGINPMYLLKQRQFAAICIVYGGTYITANSIITYCEENSLNPFYYKLAGTTAVNMFLGIRKDKYFAQSYSKKSKPSMPAASWGFFIIRDVLTIGSGFNFPQMFSTYLQEKGHFTTPATADKVAQLAVPMAMQTVLTPIHLLALDIYNRTDRGVLDRVDKVRSIYAQSVGMRMCRVAAAYGICGVVNKGVREQLREQWL